MSMKFTYDNQNDVTLSSNILAGGNPPYCLEDFLAFYPNFANLINNVNEIPTEVIDMYVQFANDCVSIKRWGNQWKYAMALFIAHFLTLYLDSKFPENASAREVIAYGQTKGLISSKSVGDVSVNYDFSSAVRGVETWGQFTLTSYGTMFANLAKLNSKGGMYIW